MMRQPGGAIKGGLGFVLGLGIGVLPLSFLADLMPAPAARPPASHVGDYAPPPRLVDDHVFRIVALGSSSTLGTGASSGAASYPSLLQSILNARPGNIQPVEVVNRGVNGEDIEDMIGRLGSDVLARQPDLVIWQTGTNDPLRDIPLATFESDLRAGLRAIRAAGVDVMLMESQWLPQEVDPASTARFRQTLRQVAREMNVTVIRRYDLMHGWVQAGLIAERDLIGPDRLHMTDGGYALLARDVATIVGRSARYVSAQAAEADFNAKAAVVARQTGPASSPSYPLTR